MELKDIKVLSVDDGEVNLLIISKLLKHAGVNTDIAKSGEDAIKLSKEKEYDLIFMDLSMPTMDGFEASRIIKALYAKQPYIYAITADMGVELHEKYNLGYIDSYIFKPYTIDVLKEKINHYLLKVNSATNE